MLFRSARLTPIGRRIGLVGDEHWDQFESRQAVIESAKRLLETTKVSGASPGVLEVVPELKERTSVASLIRRPEVRLEKLVESGAVAIGDLRREDVLAIETAIKYEGYLRQQAHEVEKLKRAEDRRIPVGLAFQELPGLSREIAEKLERIQPSSVGQASRIPGMTPAALSILLFHIERKRSAGADPAQSA